MYTVYSIQLNNTVLQLPGASPGFWFRKRTSGKISSKVARISVQSGDIQQKFTLQRILMKNLYKIVTKV